MRKTFLTLLAIMAAGPAFAQSRPSTLNMVCAEAAATVARNGAMVLATGPRTYDRFVAHAGFCSPTQTVRRATAPTSDTRHCQIGYTCEERFRMRDRF